MARFTSNQWMSFTFNNDSEQWEALSVAGDSQTLFSNRGWRKGVGKLSMKQAIYKMNVENQKPMPDGNKPSNVHIGSLKDGVLYRFIHTYDIGKGQAEYNVVEVTEGSTFQGIQLLQMAKRIFTYEQKTEEKDMKTEVKKDKVVESTSTGAAYDLAKALEVFAGNSKAGVDTDEVRRIVDEQITKARIPKVKLIEVKLPDSEERKKLGRQHYLFTEVLESVANDEYVMLKGDAGSGKTYGSIQVAKALNLNYRVFSFTNEISLGRCVGYMDAMGKYVKTAIREMYENGGMLILDEFDAMNANVAVSLNNMLSGDEYVFPDEVVNKHKDFRVIACTNTFGKGADKEYSSRNKLDAATLDRFDSIFEWGYDEELERGIFGDTPSTTAVFAIRKNAKAMGLTITPRRTAAVNKMVSRGVSLKVAVERSILSSYKGDQKRALLEGVSL